LIRKLHNNPPKWQAGSTANAAKLRPLGCSPYKNPIRGELTQEMLAYSHAISQRRIIVKTIINRLRRDQSLNVNYRDLSLQKCG